MNRLWQMRGSGVVPSSVVWTGPTSEALVQEGKSRGSSARDTQAVWGTGRAVGRSQARSVTTALQTTASPPAGRHVCRRVDHPADSLTFLPGAPPSEVKGVGRKASGRFCRELLGK